MQNSFNLLDQAWLPCVDLNDQILDQSLIDLMSNAHKLKSIQASLPVISGALYLFVMAFSHAIFRLDDEEDWEILWNKGRFPEELVNKYVSKWHQRFDLFDKHHPFYQDKKIGQRHHDLKALKGEQPVVKGISGLLLHLSSGENATLFNHSMDKSPKSYTAPELAQLLIMIQSYSLGGMSIASISSDKYYKDSPFSRGILFLGKGGNLFQTLMLNLIPKNMDPLLSSNPDLPCWEREDPFERKTLNPDGLSDLLSWQSRRILFVQGEDNDENTVKSCLCAPGLALIETFSNPYFHTIHEKEGSKLKIKPLRFKEGRTTWRDSAAILDVRNKQADVPLAIRWFYNLKAQEIYQNHNLRVDLFGICTEPGQKKAYFYSHQNFEAPLVYLEKPSLLDEFKRGLQWAENLRSALYYSVRELASYKLYPYQDVDASIKPDKNAINQLIEHINIEPIYWSKIEPAFYKYFVNLPESNESLIDWQNELKNCVRQSLAEAIKVIGVDASTLKARSKAERKLEYQIYSTFNQ